MAGGTVRPIRPAIVSVCSGSSCRKDARRVVDELSDHVPVRRGSCLGVCKGAVVVVERVDGVDVFAKVRKPSQLLALRRLAEGRRDVPEKLRRLRVGKKRRVAALRRLRRRTDRAA